MSLRGAVLYWLGEVMGAAGVVITTELKVRFRSMGARRNRGSQCDNRRTHVDQENGEGANLIQATGSILYVGEGDDLYATDTNSGKEHWKFGTGSLFGEGQQVVTRVIASGDRLFFATTYDFTLEKGPSPGRLFAFGARNGEF